ncbi:MAG: OmpA family protein [Pseudomonadales bacterium]
MALVLASGNSWSEGVRPIVGIAKQASVTRANSDGSYSVDFNLRIQNPGPEPLVTVQIRDELSVWLAPATVLSISGLRVEGALTEVRDGFDGVSENYLLSGNERLEVGEEAFVYFTLRFDAQGNPGPFENRAMAWVAGGDSGKEKDEWSQNGTDPDPDTPSERPLDNPNPEDNDEPTPIDLPAPAGPEGNPAVGLAKSATPTRTIVPGEFARIPGSGGGLVDPADVFPFVTTITLNVANVGDIALQELQLRDDLGDTFPEEVSFAVLGAISSSSGLTVNPGFDGAADTALLSGADALAVGARATLSFDVAFDPGELPGPFFNVAHASARPDIPPASEEPTVEVGDISDNGTDPDPDGDGDPTEPGENDPTPIDVPAVAEPEPVIGLAKAAAEVEALAGSEFAVTIDLLVANLGATRIEAVQVSDDLSATFADAQSFRILDAPTSAGLPVNAGYDGAADIDLLGPGAALDTGERQTVSFRVAFDPGLAAGPFFNSAFASGVSPMGQGTEDQSTNGSDPDPNGNGNPSDPGEDEPTPIAVPAGPSGPGALVGTVFFDADHDDLLSASEERLPGWRVVVRDADAEVIADPDTDAEGDYSIQELPAGDYQVRFLHPDTGVTWGQRTVAVVNEQTTRVDLPVDPQGRVYDSFTRDLVPGVSVRIRNAETGAELPPTCLLPDQQDQIIGSDAAYRFDIVAGADGRCPSARTGYQLEVLDAPQPYIVAPSTRIPANPEALLASRCSVDPDVAPPCVVQPNPLPPEPGQPSDYFLEIEIAAGDPDVVNNHMPIDRPIAEDATDLVAIQKTALTREASVGDLVFFEVRLQNLTLNDLADVFLEDDLPGGLALEPESVVLLDPGADGRTGTADDEALGIEINGTDPVSFGPIVLPANETRILRYGARVSTGVTVGALRNRISPLQDGILIGAEAAATVEIVTDPTFDDTTIIGKVFDDRDADGWQDAAYATGLVISGGPFERALDLPDLRGRRSVSDPPPRLQLDLPQGVAQQWPSSIELRSGQGSVLMLDPSGKISERPEGRLADGRSGQDLRLRMEIQNGQARLLIENHGIEERGVPGVRLATVSGLVIEADQHGRYHLADVQTGSSQRGANFILKLDAASLPDGARVVSENPRVVRLTRALMTRIDFAVQMPAAAPVALPAEPGEVLEILTRRQIADLPAVRFDTGKAQIPPSYGQRLRELLAAYDGYQNLRMTFVGHADPRRLLGGLKKRFGDNVGLSEARAKEVATFAQSVLGLDESVIGYEGRGAREPVAPNTGPLGWTANRRVEIELSWTEARERKFEVASTATLPQMGSVDRQRELTRQLPSMAFDSGDTTLDPALLATAERMIASAGEQPVRLTLIGHTDNQPLGAEQRQRYGDNQGLSLARAQAAAQLLRERLDLPVDAVVAEGRGASEPVAANDTALGRSANRRLELQVTTLENEHVERRWLRPIQDAESSYLPHGGSIWATEQPLLVTPKLDVLASQEQWLPSEPAPQFHTYNSYAGFIGRQELRVYAGSDLDRVEPLLVLPVATTGSLVTLPDQAAATLTNAAAQRRTGGHLQYLLRAYGQGDEAEIWDETAPRLLGLSRAEIGASPAPRQRAGNQVGANPVYGHSNLARQRISTQGSRVRVQGVDVDPRMQLTVAGQVVPVQANGTFVWEQQMPVGEHELLVELLDTEARTHVRRLPVRVDGNYRFAVALANLTVGQNQLQGSVEPLANDDHFDESVFVDGRIALYAKAKIQGRFLLTAQLDSTEDELSNLGDNLKREDPRRLFRQLDPDRYYPVYGDDSSTVSDVDTQGAFYVRLDFDRNSILWGNFNTGLTDTEFGQYNRSLYGAKLRHESTATTRYGDARSELTLFGSEAQSAAGHVTFAATGGSLYYLKHTDIVQGSEKVWVEVRRRDSEQVLDRQILVEGRDYEVDALQGRLLLSRPLSQVVNNRGPGIIRSTPLEGDNVFLLADYEYVPDRFAAEDVTAGGRGKLWLGDHLGVGVSKVIDERSGTDYDLEAVDVTLRAGQGTYLRAEYARSEAQQNLANFTSFDGGLTFQAVSSAGPGSDGEAIAIEARANLAELKSDLRGDVRAWWKDRDAEFSAGRLVHGSATKDAGIDLHWSPNEQLDISAGYSELDRDELGTDTVGRMQVDARSGRWQGGIEARYEDIEAGSVGSLPFAGAPLRNPPLLGSSSRLSGLPGDGEALLIGARVGYQATVQTQVYAAAQTLADDQGAYADNDLVSIGTNTQLNDRAALGLEVSDGDRGNAVMAAVDFAAVDGLNLNVASGFGSGAISQFSSRYSYGEGHELYGSYAVDPDRTEGPRDLLTLGQRRQLGNHSNVFTETQFGKGDRYSSTGHLFGIDYGGIQDWLFTATAQQSDNEQFDSDFERLAVSLGARLERDNYRLSSRLEYREDEGDSFNSRQYLSSNSVSWRVNESSRWLALLNLSWTDDEVADERDARFVEFDLGHAYRPLWNNRLNVLAKYSYLFDLPSEGQFSGRADQRAHIFSAEALYDLSRRWEVGGKLAFKKGEERINRDTGQWLDFGVRFAALRARYHVLRQWDAVLEYRWIADWQRDTEQQGALLGLYRHLGEHFKVGVGYNFAGFDDDLKREDYDNHGWFIDLIGKY